MAHPKVLHGSWEDIITHAEVLKGRKNLTLIVPMEGEASAEEENLFHATPEERARALDEIAEMNRGLPVLPPEAFERESIYEDIP